LHGLQRLLALPLQQTAWAATPPPPAVDLDKFETLKKIVALPDGVKLAYVSWGDPAGKPVVLIHGYTDNALDWVPLLPYLTKSDRLIVVDIRGHGKSSKPECCYTRFDLAYDIKLLLDALHIPKADIVGHSMGSFIAQTLAEFWPEQVKHRGADLIHGLAAAVRRRVDPQSEGHSRRGFAADGGLVQLADAGQSGHSAPPAARRRRDTVADLAGGTGSGPAGR
jgi:pimeloyl-ACP methyl ester carboxylesterase